MIRNLLELLGLSEYYAESEIIDIAKGKYELRNTISGIEDQLKREKAWRLKKQ